MDAQIKRIIEIVGEDSEKNDNTIKKYYHHLKSNIKLPLFLTGVEDFPWEEKYVLGGFKPEEYKELKKDNPSYTDIFEFMELLEPYNNEEDLFIRAKRISDNKIFELELSWLKCTEKTNPNDQLLDDFSVWQVNY